VGVVAIVVMSPAVDPRQPVDDDDDDERALLVKRLTTIAIDVPQNNSTWL
jgi:hypothetical protein